VYRFSQGSDAVSIAESPGAVLRKKSVRNNGMKSQMKNVNKAKARRKSHYKGELLQPCIRVALPKHPTPDDEAEAYRIAFTEWHRKLRLLADHYNVSSSGDDFARDMLVALTRDHVPGMRVIVGKLPAGRRRIWTSERYTALLELVSKLRRENPQWKNDTDALSAIIKRRLLDFPARAAKKAYELSSLQARLVEAKNAAREITLHPDAWAVLGGLMDTTNVHSKP
jgi:hypothetical protein